MAKFNFPLRIHYFVRSCLIHNLTNFQNKIICYLKRWNEFINKKQKRWMKIIRGECNETNSLRHDNKGVVKKQDGVPRGEFPSTCTFPSSKSRKHHHPLFVPINSTLIFVWRQWSHWAMKIGAIISSGHVSTKSGSHVTHGSASCVDQRRRRCDRDHVPLVPVFTTSTYPSDGYGCHWIVVVFVAYPLMWISLLCTETCMRVLRTSFAVIDTTPGSLITKGKPPWDSQYM